MFIAGWTGGLGLRCVAAWIGEDYNNIPVHRSHSLCASRYCEWIPNACRLSGLQRDAVRSEPGPVDGMASHAHRLVASIGRALERLHSTRGQIQTHCKALVDEIVIGELGLNDRVKVTSKTRGFVELGRWILRQEAPAVDGRTPLGWSITITPPPPSHRRIPALATGHLTSHEKILIPNSVDLDPASDIH